MGVVGLLQRFAAHRAVPIVGPAGEPLVRDCQEVRKVHYFEDKIIDRNLTEDSLKGKCVFLRAMSEKTPNRTVLRSQIINILTAGRDTTTCLLS